MMMMMMILRTTVEANWWAFGPHASAVSISSNECIRPLPGSWQVYCSSQSTVATQNNPDEHRNVMVLKRFIRSSLVCFQDGWSCMPCIFYWEQVSASFGLSEVLEMSSNVAPIVCGLQS
ncbi:hypothetical protein CRM22_001925 [Opisthorchis felineus]|uniref:Uncharacterized protein n=1 Tax=Opisthorchis felineus TaxID=147828 RepID=A0A4S2MCU4_OPIFE|nr:hypothetical protein CRM22_001925 [Opisthorchis felineus]